MTDSNFYSPPEADLETNEPAAKILADRWSRFWAAILDSIFLLLLFIPFMMLYETSFGAALISGLSDIELEIMMGVAGIIFYLILNGYLLSTSGQTIGKMIFKIQVVDYETDSLLTFNRIFSVRYLPFYFITQLPTAGFLGLIDILFIFSRENRCLHDRLAGTKVILAPDHRRANTKQVRRSKQTEM